MVYNNKSRGRGNEEERWDFIQNKSELPLLILTLDDDSNENVT